MTLDEARENVGRLVVYRPPMALVHGSVGAKLIPVKGPPEEGVITSVNDTYVFVLYRGDLTAKATRPEDLEFSLQNREKEDTRG